ncbi:hypothetical protein BBJ28_00021118 [Nothophytophthora sp. Chile5]|nr:hypothetical protein BBJ28_00021118 [Nothophytophthora sp. Chile5]
MLHSALLLALAATAAVLVDSHPEYVARLPNGDNVAGVDALGHIDPSGGGDNNNFGLDFASAGKSWTTEFCQQDSDGDGQTNGEELGDPCCEWVESSNAVVLWTSGVSHPGDASKTSDASLWADITCGSSSSSSSSSTTSSSTGPGASNETQAGSSTQTDATSSQSSATTAPASSSNGASAVAPAFFSALGVVAVALVFSA